MEFNVIVSCCSVSWGGLEKMALEHIKQLKKHEIKAKLLCIKDSKLHLSAQKSGIDKFLLIIDDGYLPVIKSLKDKLKNTDIIHTHLSHDLGYIVPSILLSRSKAKLFLTKHLASGIRKKDILHRLLYGKVTMIFAVSEFIRDNVIKTCPVERNRVAILPNGLEISKFDLKNTGRNKFRNELKISDEKIIITLIGRLTPGKGHFELLEAAEILNKQFGNRIVFIIAGGTSAGEEHIEARIRQITGEKNINNIIFTGFRSDITNILGSTDILVFPSHEESFGITLLEAMAMEVPVVTSNNAGIRDIIPSEEFGILVPPKDPASLAEGIIKLINEPELRNKLAASSRKRIEDNFDIEKITEKLLKYYDLPKIHSSYSA